jgi:hypothetical protein
MTKLKVQMNIKEMIVDLRFCHCFLLNFDFELISTVLKSDNVKEKHRRAAHEINVATGKIKAQRPTAQSSSFDDEEAGKNRGAGGQGAPRNDRAAHQAGGFQTQARRCPCVVS